MNIYIVQHGKAMPSDIDIERPLNRLGVDETDKMAYFIRKNIVIQINTIYSSPKKRSMQTAAIFDRYFAPQNGIMGAEWLLPEADPSEFMNKIESFSGDIMVISHKPLIPRLLSSFLCGQGDFDLLHVVNSSVTCISDIDGKFRIEWCLRPDNIA